MNSDDMNDADFNAFLHGEDDLSRQLQSLPQHEPSAALDAAILAQATLQLARTAANDPAPAGHPALDNAPPPAVRPLRRLSARWTVPAGIAATLLVGVLARQSWEANADLEAAQYRPPAPAAELDKSRVILSPAPPSGAAATALPPLPSASVAPPARDVDTTSESLPASAKMSKAKTMHESVGAMADVPLAPTPAAAAPAPAPALTASQFAIHSRALADQVSATPAPAPAPPPAPALFRAPAPSPQSYSKSTSNYADKAASGPVNDAFTSALKKEDAGSSPTGALSIPSPVREEPALSFTKERRKTEAPAVASDQHADAWLALIDEMLKAGLSTEALEEWTRFRLAHPTYPVPDQLGANINAQRKAKAAAPVSAESK